MIPCNVKFWRVMYTRHGYVRPPAGWTPEGTTGSYTHDIGYQYDGVAELSPGGDYVRVKMPKLAGEWTPRTEWNYATIWVYDHAVIGLPDDPHMQAPIHCWVGPGRLLARDPDRGYDAGGGSIWEYPIERDLWVDGYTKLVANIRGVREARDWSPYSTRPYTLDPADATVAAVGTQPANHWVGMLRTQTLSDDTVIQFQAWYPVDPGNVNRTFIKEENGQQYTAPTLRAMLGGDMDERYGIKPSDIKAAWIAPIPPWAGNLTPTDQKAEIIYDVADPQAADPVRWWEIRYRGGASAATSIPLAGPSEDRAHWLATPCGTGSYYLTEDGTATAACLPEGLGCTLCVYAGDDLEAAEALGNVRRYACPQLSISQNSATEYVYSGQAAADRGARRLEADRQAVSGLTDAGLGAMLGAAAGGPVGAAVGAVGGALGAAAGYAMDVHYAPQYAALDLAQARAGVDALAAGGGVDEYIRRSIGGTWKDVSIAKTYVGLDAMTTEMGGGVLTTDPPEASGAIRYRTIQDWGTTSAAAVPAEARDYVAQALLRGVYLWA